jgi:hypothetical protein
MGAGVRDAGEVDFFGYNSGSSYYETEVSLIFYKF